MKFKYLLSLCLAGASMSAMAQGYKDGVEYFKADRYDNAEELLNRNLNNADTNKAEAYYYLGQIKLARYFSGIRQNHANAAKYKSEALNYFNQGVSANPEFSFNYVGLGAIALIDNNSKLAEENFKKAEKLDKKDAGVFAAIARAYYDVNPNLYAKQIQNYMEKGDKLVLKQVLSSNPKWADNDQDFYIFRGDMTFADSDGDSKKVGEACNDYEYAISINPSAAEGYIKYAEKLFTIKRNSHAINQLRTLLQNNPQSALGQRELAERLYEDGQIVSGIEEYGKLMDNPNHFKSDEDRYLTLLYFTKDYNKGYQEATEILTKNPDQFTARRFQYIFANLLEKPETIQLAEQLLKLKSDKNRFATGDYSMIAEDLVKAGRAEEAVSVLNMGVADYPDEPSILKSVARSLYMDLNKNMEAADMMLAYVDKVGAEVTGTELSTLSDYAVVTGQEQTDPELKEKYLQMSEDAIKKAEPKLADKYKFVVYKRMGDVARMRGDMDKAVAEYQAALKNIEASGISDDNKREAANMYKVVGVTLGSAKNPEAREYVTKYLEIMPDDQDMAKYLTTLK
jgi:tetratricopeptide (TPR) repeat protein